jgi:hypothetical protein
VKGHRGDDVGVASKMGADFTLLSQSSKICSVAKAGRKWERLSYEKTA